MKVAKKLILLFRDSEGFGNAIFDALGSNSQSNLQRLESSFELSLENYGIKDCKASGSIRHFINENGAYEVSVLLMENYQPPVLACALNEVLSMLLGENSSEIPALVVPCVVTASNLKMENKNVISTSDVSVYGMQYGPATDSMQALGSKLQKPVPSLQIYHQQLACFLQFVPVLTASAFVMVGQISQGVSPETSERDLEVIHEVGELLASYSSLSFSKERISWNPTKSSMGREEPWRALYG